MNKKEILKRHHTQKPDAKITAITVGEEFWITDRIYVYVYKRAAKTDGASSPWKQSKKYPNAALLITNFKNSTRRALLKGEVDAESMEKRWTELIKAAEKYLSMLDQFIK